MTPEVARNAMILLSRTDIKGGEAPVFMQVMQALQEIAESKAPTEGAPMKLVSNE